MAGDKSGVSESRFYKHLLAKADQRFEAHLARLVAKERGDKKLKKKERK